MKTFKLKIELGNDAMQSSDDLARALRRVAIHIENGETEGVIHDVNGNRVGSWSTK